MKNIRNMKNYIAVTKKLYSVLKDDNSKGSPELIESLTINFVIDEENTMKQAIIFNTDGSILHMHKTFSPKKAVSLKILSTMFDDLEQ